MAQQSSARTWTQGTPDIGVWSGAPGGHLAKWQMGLEAPGPLFGGALVVGAAGIEGAGPLVPSGMCAPGGQEASLQLPPRWSPPGAVGSRLAAALLPSSRFSAGVPCPAESRASLLPGRGCCRVAGGMAGWVRGARGRMSWQARGLWTNVCSSV